MTPTQLSRLLPAPRIASSLHFHIDPIHSHEDLLEPSNHIPEGPVAYRLLCLLRGNGKVLVDMQSWSLEPGSVFFIRPGQLYRVDPHSDLNGYLISFGESFLGIDDERVDSAYSTDLLQFFFRNQVVRVHEGIMNDLEEIIGKLLKELNNHFSFRTEMLRRYFKIFLVYLTREFEAVMDKCEQTRTTELVKSFMLQIEKDYLSKKMVTDYACDLSVTPNYLNQIVKKMTGQSAGYHIRQRVALEAKRKAVYSNKCMKEIAYHLGFSDPCHFSKFFKKTTGLNFVDYRKRKPVVPTFL